VAVSDSARWRAGADVYSLQTPALTAPVHIGGAPIADSYAAHHRHGPPTGVKLIDVYPDEVPSQPGMGG